VFDFNCERFISYFCLELDPFLKINSVLAQINRRPEDTIVNVIFRDKIFYKVNKKLYLKLVINKVLTWFVEFGKKLFGSRLGGRRSALQKVRRHQ
jgi:hypothetical protein